jgi:hypothetical protein
MPLYRLIFPTDEAASRAKTAHIESDVEYKVGDAIEHHGKTWYVSEAPSDQLDDGEPRDLLVWPSR